MIRSMGMEYIVGLMVKNIEENGNLDNNMERVFILLWMERLKRDYGRMVN